MASKIPDFVDVIGQDGVDNDIMNMFQDLVNEYDSYRQSETEFKKLKDEDKNAINALIDAHPALGRVKLPNFTVSRNTSERKSIDESLLKVALLDLGLKPEQIKEVLGKATKVSSSTTLLIRQVKEKT